MFQMSNLRRLAGKTVIGRDGERIGKVTSVYESTEGGGGTFATVATGLFGTRSSFFPLDEAELRDDDLVVPYTKDHVRQAPHVADDEDLTAEDEQRLFAHYGLAGDDGTQVLGHGLGGSGTDAAMTLSEERLQVGTERVETGRARLRKYVVSETVTRTVPVSHQELRVTREPVADAGPATAVRELAEEVHEIVLTAERPVVEKQVVPVERVRLETVTVDEQETVTAEVRREQVELDSEGPAAGR